MLRDLDMAGMLKDIDVVHCHTWYTHLAGCLVKQLTGARLVLTTHSLEPHRPWKVEQLGSAYQRQLVGREDCLRERRRRDRRLRLDAGRRPRPLRRPSRQDPRHPQRDRPEPVQADAGPGGPDQYGIDPNARSCCSSGGSPGRRGSSTWSGDQVDPSRVQVVLCAGAPDTPEIGREMDERVARPRRRESTTRSSGLPEIVPKDDIITLYTHADALRLPVGLRAVRDHQPRGDGVRDAGGGVGGGRDQGGGRPRARPACSSRSSRRAGPTSSRGTRRGSPATLPTPSTACSTIPSG